MKTGLILFRVTGAALLLQLLLGGLLTFGFISPDVHIVAGFALLILAIATMAAWFVSRPVFKPMRMITSAIVVLILLQIVIGFATLNSGSQAIAFVHFANALAIFGATISGTFMAMRWDHMARGAKVDEAEASRGTQAV